MKTARFMPGCFVFDHHPGEPESSDFERLRRGV